MTTEHFNQLSPARAERLAILAEECGEVVQIVGKILRHGYQGKHPDTGVTNTQALEEELGHLEYAISRLVLHDVDPSEVRRHATNKMHTIHQWLHHTTAT